jgi:CRISPR/Cas system-associated exonuclease Cas4 (RecB family)
VPPKGREVAAVNVADEAFDEPPSRLALPKKYLSISQVNMYLRCPKQYEFRYVKDKKQPPAVPLALGTSGHAALETTHHHIVDHDVPAPTEQLLDSFSDKWTELSAQIEDWEGEQPGHVKDKGVALVRIYNERFAPTVKPQADAEKKERGIEKKFEITVGGVPMLGYIDLIDTNSPVAFSEEELALMAKYGRVAPEELRSAVVDFKFKSKSMAQSEVDGSLQMTLYSLATGIYAIRFDQLLKTKKPTVKRAAAVRTKQDHLWLQRVVRDVADAISKGVFPPTDPTSWSCNAKWCGYFHLCRGKTL